MSYPLLDTSVIIRLLTGDDLEKQVRARALFEEIEHGNRVVSAPATVIAEAVYVLSSPRLYNRRRDEVTALLTPLVQLPGFRVQGRRTVLVALQLYGTTAKLDFVDALLAALARQARLPVISYDTDLTGLWV